MTIENNLELPEEQDQENLLSSKGNDNTNKATTGKPIVSKNDNNQKISQIPLIQPEQERKTNIQTPKSVDQPKDDNTITSSIPVQQPSKSQLFNNAKLNGFKGSNKGLAYYIFVLAGEFSADGSIQRPDKKDPDDKAFYVRLKSKGIEGRFTFEVEADSQNNVQKVRLTIDDHEQSSYNNIIELSQKIEDIFTNK